MKHLILITLILFTFIFTTVNTPSSHSLAAIPRYASSPYYAIGVSSLGNSGPISTNEVLGYVYIQSISASSAALEFNAVIKATNYFGFVYDFWVQNMIVFSNGNYYFQDEVWNLTLPYANIYQNEITGYGSVESTTINGKTVSYYVHSTSSAPIVTPMSYTLFIEVSYSGNTINVEVGYGSPSSPTSFTYDYINIQVPELASATICVSSADTGAGLLYDVELVWGGAGNGQVVSFSNLYSQLAIFYQVEPGLYSPFSVVYNHGFDTQEATNNLYAYIGNNGLVTVSTGTPYPERLTSYFTPLIPGWTEVTVFSNETYSVNGYNFTYNSNHDYSPPNYGLSYFVSFTTNSQITVTIYSFREGHYILYPEEICVINPFTNSKYNTTQTTITVPTNSYYQILVYYHLRPLIFHLTINIPMWGIVNGTPMLVKSGYYYYGTVIELPPINYSYINSFERIAYIPNVTTIIVTENVSIFVNEIYQYYVEINTKYPLYGYVNGIKISLTSEWFNQSELLDIPSQIYYVSNEIREVLLNPTEVTITSPFNYTANWLTQYYVNVITEYPLYALVNGKNESLASGWYNESERIDIYSQIYYVNLNVREVLLNPLNVVLSSPLNYTANWLTQYYVIVSFPVNASINSKYVVFSTGWYNKSEKIVINVNPQYVSSDERVYIYNKTPIIIVVNSPLKVIINASVQFLVNFEMPVVGKINGSLENLTTGWYNIYTQITLNETYFKYISKSERIMYIPSYTHIIVNQSYNITFRAITQFYLIFNTTHELQGVINGKKMNLTNGWYNESEKINIPFQYFIIGFDERCALLNPTVITVNKSLTYNALWGIQFYVNVVSLKPVYALINGTNTSFVSGWYNKFDEIEILNMTYYVNSTVRYSVYNVTPSMKLQLNSPLNITVNYLPEYLVTINGKSFWAFKGSKITLYQFVPFYYSAKWVGTYTTNNNATITVNSPVQEKIVYQVNIINIVSVILTILTLGVIVVKLKIVK